MQSLTTLSELNTFPNGKNDQACLNATSLNATSGQSSIVMTPNPGGHSAGGVVLLMLGLFCTGLIYGGFFDRLKAYGSGPLETYFLNAGIILKKIHIRGQVALKDEKIIRTLGLKPGESLFGFDAIVAQKRLSQLGHVETARIMRLLPSTLLVEIVERVPFARWAHDGRTDLIDKHGVVLQRVSGSFGRDFPLVAGAGAGKKAAQLIRILSTHEDLAGRIRMAVRVGEYRWDLHARSGAVIKLPAANLALGLARLVELPDWNELLGQKKLVIDLRHPERTFVGQATVVSAAYASSS